MSYPPYFLSPFNYIGDRRATVHFFSRKLLVYLPSCHTFHRPFGLRKRTRYKYTLIFTLRSKSVNFHTSDRVVQTTWIFNMFVVTIIILIKALSLKDSFWKKNLFNCSPARGQIVNCLDPYRKFSLTCFLTTSIKSKLQSIIRFKSLN